MDVRSAQIKNLLWKEVASKSSTAAIAFSFFAILIYIYHFQLVQMKFYIQLASIGVIASNIIRIWISKKIVEKNIVTGDDRNILRMTIWLNSIFWSVIFAFGAYELNSTGFHFIILITIMTGFLGASIVTLAYDKTLFIPFQFLTLLPLLGVATYQTNSGANPLAYFLVIIYTVFILYQMRQYREYRAQLMQRFNYQLDLEDSFIELKKSQTALIEQTSQLIHASKISALGEMAGGLAHEINNSLMIILGSTQQIQREMGKTGELKPDVENKFRQSTASIMKIKSVIEGLKQFSLQMGPQPKEDIPLREIIERTMSYTAELLKAHQTKFIIENIPDVSIHCHPFQMTQVLFNLIKNADDAIVDSPPEGHWVKILFAKEGENILMRVVNGGAIVLEENVQKLFQPFFTTKDVGQGTGLSLSISKGIARDHKGDLYFEKNRYTTFVLKLPTV